jgi:hypothetical protein
MLNLQHSISVSVALSCKNLREYQGHSGNSFGYQTFEDKNQSHILSSFLTSFFPSTSYEKQRKYHYHQNQLSPKTCGQKIFFAVLSHLSNTIKLMKICLKKIRWNYLPFDKWFLKHSWEFSRHTQEEQLQQIYSRGFLLTNFHPRRQFFRRHQLLFQNLPQ